MTTATFPFTNSPLVPCNLSSSGRVYFPFPWVWVGIWTVPMNRMCWKGSCCVISKTKSKRAIQIFFFSLTPGAEPIPHDLRNTRTYWETINNFSSPWFQRSLSWQPASNIRHVSLQMISTPNLCTTSVLSRWQTDAQNKLCCCFKPLSCGVIVYADIVTRT